MACYGERPEGTEIATIGECDEGEGDDDQEDCFFVDVPAEEEGGIAAEGDGSDEGFPGWGKEELGERDELEDEGEEEGCTGGDFGEHGEGGVAY